MPRLLEINPTPNLLLIQNVIQCLMYFKEDKMIVCCTLASMCFVLVTDFMLFFSLR